MPTLRLLDGPAEHFDAVIIALDPKDTFSAVIIGENGRIESAAEVTSRTGAFKFYSDYGIDQANIEATNNGWVAYRAWQLDSELRLGE